MKQFAKFLSLAALAAAFVSCVKENEKPVVDAAEGIQLTINAGAPATKTYVEGLTPYWKSTDVLGVFTGSDNTNAQFPNTRADGKNGVFTGTVPSEGKYYAYYPYSNIYGANTTGVSCKFPEEQHPTPTSFDGAADFLVSEAFDVTSTDAQTLDKLIFKRVGAFLKFSFKDATTGSILSGEYVKEVKVIVNVEGDYRPCPAFRMTPDGIGTVGGGMKTITAKYDDNVYELTANGNAAWFGIRPNTFAAGNTFDLTITTTKRTLTKTITLSSAVEVKGGDILPINVTFTDTDTPLAVTKLWEKLSTTASNWFTAIGGSAGNDFNIAIDDKNVYVPEFGTSKNLWAIDIATGNTIKKVGAEYIESVGYPVDGGTVSLACARVVKKADGTPVLLATNLFQDNNSDNTGRLYIWDNGIDNAPRVATMKQWGAGRRLGDTFTTYGDYEDCWLIMSTQAKTVGDLDGFVTFKVPAGGTSTSLISRLATTTGNFCSYYPFPGELTKGMFSWRGGSHDDGENYRNRLMTIASTEEAIKASGAHTAELSKLTTYMDSYENNNGCGYNFIEFEGKRFVIWVINRPDNNMGFDLVIKSGSKETAWNTIINTSISTLTANGHFAYRENNVGGLATTWKKGADCAVWNTGKEVYIAVNKTNVGIVVYKLSR